jgi:hypothetical protein
MWLISRRAGRYPFGSEARQNRFIFGKAYPGLE